MFVFACSINLLKELREDQQRMLINIPKNCEGPPCGECHLRPNELCDICGRRAPARLEENDCPGHVSSEHDGKICRHCGVHIDSLRPDGEQP
jgi:hypothetical protein